MKKKQGQKISRSCFFQRTMRQQQQKLENKVPQANILYLFLLNIGTDLDQTFLQQGNQAIRTT
jgi:hypothetical protein